MSEQTTRAVIVRSYPSDKITADLFQVVDRPVEKIKDGQLLAETKVISVDPYLRFCMGMDRYGDTWQIGEPARGFTVGKVLDSKDSKFKVNDMILSYQAPWCLHAAIDTKTVLKVRDDLTPEEALGVCGMPHWTAYFGMEMAQPKQGETIVVSGGAGAVGSTVGMIAKMKGLRVIGIAGSNEKLKLMMDEFGFDEGINYKETKDMNAALKKSCPNGIDIYWDNVGGSTLEAATNNMNGQKGARVVSCGAISGYTSNPNESASDRAQQIGKEKGIKVIPLLVFDFKDRWNEAIDNLAEWYHKGYIKKKTTVYKGITQVPQAFEDLFAGKNLGKMLIDVSSDRK